MQDVLSTFLVDFDTSRRHEIYKAMVAEGLYTVPCASLSELAIRWPDEGLLLIVDQDGLLDNAIQENEKTGNWLPIIALSDSPRPQRVMEAARSGVAEYLAWPASGDDLRSAIESISAYTPENCEEKRNSAFATSLVRKLSKRELEVLEHLSQGQTNKAIARELGISHRTVEIHRANMMRKLEVSHPIEAVKIGLDASKGRTEVGQSPTRPRSLIHSRSGYNAEAPLQIKVGLA